MKLRFGLKHALCTLTAAILVVAASCNTSTNQPTVKTIGGSAPVETPVKPVENKGAWTPAAAMAPVKVELKRSEGKVELLRDGKPYFIKGAGGTNGHKELAEYGGNSFRTWGVDEQTGPLLDEAQQLGLTVCQGFWVEKKTEGFKTGDPAAEKGQQEKLRAAVMKYRNHPAILFWAIGNEMENGNDTPELWGTIEAMAKIVKELDPNHPTMTVVAELGGNKVANIHKYCPSIDVVGINSYAGGPSAGKRYKDQAAKYFKDAGQPAMIKPFAMTEFGPFGQWETGRNNIGAVPEKTSTEKVEFYRNTYNQTVLGNSDYCLGSYAFLWGYKVEATSTWYGMFLPDGSKVGAVDAMSQLWTGKPVEHPCPVVHSIKLNGANSVPSGETVTATLEASDPKGDKLKYEWVLLREVADYNAQDPSNKAGANYAGAIVKNGEATVTIKMPALNGLYRIYGYVRNEHGGAALGSIPIQVKGGEEPPFKAPAAKLPFVIYGEGKRAGYIPSGYAGDYAFVKMDEKFAANPHSGNASIKCEYTVTIKDGGGFNSPKPAPAERPLIGTGGVVWQSPVNDWGDKPGGFDFTGAKKLTVWARGDKGGEKVTLGFGYLTADREAGKKYYDSSKNSIDVTLTPEWKQYTIELSGKDLKQIKSGFFWETKAAKEPTVFYLADVKIE